MRVVSVQADSFHALMGVLEREHESLRPTRAQGALYWLFIADVGFLQLSLIPALYYAWRGEPWPRPLTMAMSALAALVLPLFLLNVPVLLRLWRYFAMLRRLRLTRDFGRLVSHYKKRDWLSGVVAYIAAISGVALFVIGATLTFRPSTLVPEIAVDRQLAAAGAIVAGVALFSLPYLRGGYRRLRAINAFLRAERDRARLRFDISAADWKTLARVEREQLARSAVEDSDAVHTEPRSTRYEVLTSAAAQEAKQQLDTAMRVAVQNQIVALMVDPRPPESTEKGDTRSIAVEGEPIEITYDVNDDKRQIRIIGLSAIS